MISGEKMMYYSQLHKQLKIFDLFSSKIIEFWPQEIELNSKFNYCMWLNYNVETKRALFLYMVEKNKFILESFTKDGGRDK